ncbi:ATP-binding protein [Mycobacterium sp. NPDC051804]|uniref:ATP-binding protein n=1 Tax=Mycobacterium sp. NPDC051804 TaxID=3364295 RepID=UPI003798BB8C
MNAQAPSGTVTFLLTDLEGSTRAWEQDPNAMRPAMVRHDELLEQAFAANNGYVFSRMGDGMAVAFATAGDAIVAALAIKETLAAENWATASTLKARIGLHTAEAVIVDDTGYANLPINRCARLMAAAHGGQIVISGATEALVRGDLPAGTELLDLGEHRLRDLGSPIRVFQLSPKSQYEDFPPLRSVDSFPGNLPAQVSSFIGRQTEVSRVAAALDDSRAVTVTGVGGVGKTRLAIQVAADLLPRYREGVWLVELAPVTEQSGVAEAVAEVVHPLGRSGQSLEDSLIETLSQKQLLLVLDNCEHVLVPVAHLVSRIEQSCPEVAVLATSREGMAIDGEQLIALPPLAAGQPDDDIDYLIHTDAVSLFVERARKVKADFALNDNNSRSVVEICQRLDGVPLAIELAAARVIALSPTDLLRRLDRRFELLAGGRRGAVGRHATLRAAIDWSYELLDTAEQRMLARLSVFSGGATLEAIEDVCSGDPVERSEALDLATSLVSRSLVIAEEHATGMRYRLLETIRQYSEERLAGYGEIAALRAAHTGFYADLLTEAATGTHILLGLAPSQTGLWLADAIGQIGVERENIRSALANAIEAVDVARAIQIVANHPHRDRANASRIGQIWLVPASRVIDLPGAAEHPDYPRVLMVSAYEALDTGDQERASELCRKALEAASNRATPLKGQPIEIDVFTLKAEEALAAGAYTDAVTTYERAAELAQTSGFPGTAAIVLAYSVTGALIGGMDLEQATARAQEAITLARQTALPGAIVIALNAVAMALADRDPEQARACLQESVELSTTPGQEIAASFITASLAAVRLRDWNLTLSMTGRAMLMYRGIMNPLHTAPCLVACARALAETRPDVGGVLIAAAFTNFRRWAPSDGTAPPTASGGSARGVISETLRETSAIVETALGRDRALELRRAGSAMGLDEAVAFALDNIDPKLVTGPIASIDV